MESAAPSEHVMNASFDEAGNPHIVCLTRIGDKWQFEILKFREDTQDLGSEFTSEAKFDTKEGAILDSIAWRESQEDWI